MKLVARFTAIASLTLISFSQQASATVLYDQPWDGGTNGSYASQNDTNEYGNFATAFDDFNLSNSATITNIAWTGGYFNPPSQGTITGFTLQIYSDNDGLPGNSLYSVSVPGTANETFLDSNNGYPYFSYNASVNFAATGGAEYWLSVVPNLGFPPQWGWATGTGGNQNAQQVFFGSLNPLDFDLAFTLSGSVSATPLPSTWTMLIAGIVGLGFFAYRGSRKNASVALAS